MNAINRDDEARSTQLSGPATAPTLLRLLRVDQLSVTRQAPALTAWFRENVPTPALRCSMLANGYGRFLDRAGRRRLR